MPRKKTKQINPKNRKAILKRMDKLGIDIGHELALLVEVKISPGAVCGGAIRGLAELGTPKSRDKEARQQLTELMTDHTKKFVNDVLIIGEEGKKTVRPVKAFDKLIKEKTRTNTLHELLPPIEKHGANVGIALTKAYRSLKYPVVRDFLFPAIVLAHSFRLLAGHMTHDYEGTNYNAHMRWLVREMEKGATLDFGALAYDPQHAARFRQIAITRRP